jgi:four helix bundle protein
MSNIAEGHGRGGNKEFIQFLSVARGSASEVTAQLYVALDQGYLTREESVRLQEQAVRTGSVISGLIRYLKSMSLPGSKFKPESRESPD